MKHKSATRQQSPGISPVSITQWPTETSSETGTGSDASTRNDYEIDNSNQTDAGNESGDSDTHELVGRTNGPAHLLLEPRGIQTPRDSDTHELVGGTNGPAYVLLEPRGGPRPTFSR